MNFETARPLRDILLDYKSVLERVFDPAAYANRLDRLVSLVDCSGRPRELPAGDLRSKFSSLDRIHRILSELPTREPFRKVLSKCVNTNPAVISYIVMLMAVYLHLGPYSRYIIASIERRLAALDAEGVPAVAAE